METLSTISAWIAANPAWAWLGVFLIAFLESLALVGLLLPGVVLMFAVGALVGTDTLPLWPTIFWAAAGAIAGDWISFWLGRHLQQRLHTIWPLRGYPQLLAKATRLFHRHGGKSIFLGRFIGPVRPVIPAVAGVLGMERGRFLFFNILSALLWAPAYLLPGIIFGASLGLATEIASRLALMIALLIGTLLLIFWLLRLLFELVHRHAFPLIRATLLWADRHPRLGRIPAALLDPEESEARGVTMLALLLLFASTLFALLLRADGTTGFLFNIDSYLLNSATAMQTPPMNAIFSAIAILGEWQVLLPLALGVPIWLWRCRNYHALRHWLAAVVVGTLLGLNLCWLERGIAPIPDASLCGGQLVIAVAIYAFLATIIAREYPESRRWPIYALATILLLGIAVARLYLGESRLSGISGALLLGGFWIAMLGIGYRNHPAERVRSSPLLLVTAMLLLGAIGWYAPYHQRELAQRHAATAKLEIAFTREDWLAERWRELPTYRADLRAVRDHPLNLQYLGEPAALIHRLTQRGWSQPRRLDAFSWLAWLAEDAPLSQLAVLPQVHAGRNESLLLVREEPAGRAWLALRLWPADYRRQPGGEPLWLGNVTLLRPILHGGLLRAPRTQDDFDTPLRLLLADLEGLPYIRRQLVSAVDGWDGTVALIGEIR